MFCSWISSCSRTICLKENPFSIDLPLHFCCKLVVHTYVGQILHTLFCSTDLPIYLNPNTTTILITVIWNQTHNFLFSKLFWLWFFAFPYQFYQSVNFYKKIKIKIKSLQRFSSEMCWIYRSTWRELTSQYWVFWPTNKVHHSTYVGL